MKTYQIGFVGIVISLLLAATNRISAQCNAPNALSLVPPQTSTALVVKWNAIPGVTQYQIRYYATNTPSDKTIVDNCGPSPFTLRGLRKNTLYTLEIRSKCGNTNSSWGGWLSTSTINSSGQCTSPLAGVVMSPGVSDIKVSWTSSGSHTIRYRSGDSGDWLIPSGAMSVSSSPYTIAGLSPGAYQVEIKRNCSGTTGDYQRSIVIVEGSCATPLEPSVNPGMTSALIVLPSMPGVTGYNILYRPGTTGAWINGGNNIPPSVAVLNPPLLPATQYQVSVQALCALASSIYSPPATFTTLAPTPGSCLFNKNAGKNMSAADIAQLNQVFNNPSPFNFGSMIGVNDGGLIFRSFQNESFNPITQLTLQFRNFHTMDEDFNANLVNYELSIKPKNTIPEGYPSNTVRNKNLYTLYRQTHGFSNVTAALELLQYGPQTWKEKIYKESDWSMLGPAGIQASFETYTKKFIDEFAPPNGSPAQILTANYQVGNELWDYPFAIDYHSMLIGARNGLVSKYGPKSAGGWKMKFVAGAFQAARDNTCVSMLRDFSNCGADLQRFDFIGDYLDVSDCEVLKDLDAIDCHPYSFKPGTTIWTYPEDPASETWQIRNLAAWLNANRNAASGVLNSAHLWSTEYGFDSSPVNGVGEKTQSAFLLRGLFMHSRYHYQKVFFYNAYDQARPTDGSYTSLYNSAGFWKLGTDPNNPNWASPLVAHGAVPKPAWYGMLDMKSRFSNHVFYKALVEDNNAYVILIAKPDGTDPYLVFWSPIATNDANINQNITLSKSIDWTTALGGNFKLESTNAQNFAESTAPGQTFTAANGLECGNTILTTIRRSPAFIRLVSCPSCQNITQPGSISAPNPSSGNSPFNPGIILSTADASGGTGGVVEYQWQQSTNNLNYTDIPGATSLSYDPPSLTQGTYFRRAAKRSTCADLLFTPSVFITVGTSACPGLISFQRQMHTISGCNPNGDYYYELTINQVSANDQITLSGLPSNGINTSMSMLNGIPFTPATFQANLNFINNNSLKWLVNASLGSAQTLRLYYCWADAYPSPPSLTSAISQCSGQTILCTSAFNLEGEERNEESPFIPANLFQFKLAPNPGREQVQLTYEGPSLSQATLRIVSATGQNMLTQHFTEVEDQQQWDFNTEDFAPGIYFVCLQTGKEVKWVVWERL